MLTTTYLIDSQPKGRFLVAQPELGPSRPASTMGSGFERLALDMSRFELLTLDMSNGQCHYRFLRRSSTGDTIVYVHVQTPSVPLISLHSHGPDVITELRRLVSIWDQEWTTLTIFLDAEGNVKYTKDEWRPHYLPILEREKERVNILDLETIRILSERVFLVLHNGQRRVLKICPFKRLLPLLLQELRAYFVLQKRGCKIIPQVTAFVYERSKKEVIGFLCEEIIGETPTPDDYEMVKQGVEKLHGYGVVHGDLNKYNMMITTEGLRFLDLESTIFDEDGKTRSELSRLRKLEIDGLLGDLKDNRGYGRPISPELDDGHAVGFRETLEGVGNLTVPQIVIESV